MSSLRLDRPLPVALAIAMLLAPSIALGDVLIRAQCRATGLDSSTCIFTNTGSDTGKGCATMRLVNESARNWLESLPACSGLLAPGGEETVAARFPKDPSTVCGAGLASCKMEVKMSNIESAPSGPTNLIISLMVLVSSIWVLIDARRIGARKGLVTGLADLSPTGWFVACLLLWIIAFPMYLVKRGTLKAAAARKPAAAKT